MAVNPLSRIYQGGYIFTLHTATKEFICAVCKKQIVSGERYYSVVLGGGGLGWIKFPPRIHLNEVEDYLRSREVK